MKQFANRVCFFGCIAASLVTPSTSVNSAQQGIQFGGFVGLGRFCQILLTQGGTIAPNFNSTELNSFETGGVAGRAQIRTSRVTTGARFTATLDAPSNFTSAPPEFISGADFGVNYEITYSVFDFNDPNGDPNTIPINSGSFSNLNENVSIFFPRHATRVDFDVHLTSVANSGTFPAGNYSAETTLRCE